MRAFLSALLQSPILRPPVFEEAERTRVARYLYYILLSTLIGMVGFMLMPPLLGDLDVWYVIICGGVSIICLTLLFLVRRGYVRLTSILFIGGKDLT